jgi:hypothetical protein
MTAENSAGFPTVTCHVERRGQTTAERQASYRAPNRRPGLVTVALLVPAAAIPDLQLAAAAMRRACHLLPGPLRDPISGKLVSAKSALTARPLAVDGYRQRGLA